MKSMNQAAVLATLPAGVVAIRAASPASAVDRSQTTVLHAEHLYTRDWVPVNIAVALHWHIRDAQKAVAGALARSNVKDATQSSLREVVGSIMIGALLVEHAMVELSLCKRMTSAVAGLGIEVHSCRIRHVAVPPDVRESGVTRVLEQLGEVLHRHRVIRRWGLERGETVLIENPPHRPER